MSRSSLPLLFLLGALALSAGLHAGLPAPISRQLEIAPPPGAFAFNSGPTVIQLGENGFVVAWLRIATGAYVPEKRDSINVRRLDASGRLRAQFVRELAPRGEAEGIETSSPVVAAFGDRFIVAWSDEARGQPDHEIWYDLFEQDGSPVFPQPRKLEPPPGQRAHRQYPAVAGNRAGRFAIAWINTTFFESVATPMVQMFDRSGLAITPELPAGEPLWLGRFYSPAAGLDAAGNAVVVWKETSASLGWSERIMGQRFDAAGLRQGENFVAGGGSLGSSSSPMSLAMAESGEFVIGYGIEDYHYIVLQSFRADGQPAAPGIIAGRAEADLPSYNTPALAVDIDRFLNVAVLWLDGGKTVLKLFNSHLVRQGPAVVDRMSVTYHDPRAGVALMDDGRILTTWIGPRWQGGEGCVLGRFWQAPKDADLCVFRDGRFLCDTANDGGTAEERIRFGQFRDVPFLADFDGDGRADPCVYRESRLFCDTAHDGGAAEDVWSVPVDLVRGLLALGDIDGDGRADPCVRQGSRWSCDLDRDGAPDLNLSFGTDFGTSLLGDVDGDGRADPCIVRKGQFQCDVAHNGGAPELTLDLRMVIDGKTGPLLLGDVNGDGRADPCIYSSGRLICGLFPPGAGKPTGVIKLNFGVEGDWPVLGNLDAF